LKSDALYGLPIDSDFLRSAFSAGLAHPGRLRAELKAGGYNGDMRNGEEIAR
jgi:hypothetical protein